MSEPNNYQDYIDIKFLNVDKNLSEALQKKMKNSFSMQFIDGIDQEVHLNCKVVVLPFKSSDFSTKLSLFNKIFDLDSAIAVLVIDQGLTENEFLQLAKIDGVFGIVNSEDFNELLLQKAIADYDLCRNLIDNRLKIKEQNNKLELFNQNLENLVHERTKKEFEASHATENSLKAIQSILNFIKNVSKSQSIEDLLLHLQGEFKKISGLMPPILILDEGVINFRVFFFQGKQLIEKFSNTSSDRSKFYSEGEAELRAALSNYFGRPFGPLKIRDLSFQPKELQGVKARIIFEHSFESQNNLETLRQDNERWTILALAIENLLLKEGMQNIAKQWSRTFNKMKDPILILDENFQMSLSNSSYHKVENKVCYQSFANNDKACKDCPLTRTFNSGESQTSNVHMGSKVFRVHSYPIRIDEEGRVSHAINQYVDITQTIDLRSRVIQGEKMAAVGLLAGNIAHELNNPLTGIYSLAELLLEDFERETNTYNDMVEIKEAAKRCQRIIKDLLDFSSVESQSKPKVIDVNSIINKTLPLLKMAMREMNSQVELAPEELLVNCNPQLLQQVIFNLINNACQAMEEGGVLSVTTAEVAGQIKISIKDTGPGIPNEIKDFIFDPFFTTKEEGKGTGLGLSMSRSIVQRAGGDLLLNESYQDGTEFLITLPEVQN